MDDRSSDPLAAFRTVNVEGTQRLAQQAVEAGVRRLVFLSSLKVLGEDLRPDNPCRHGLPHNRQTPMAQSKWEAETALRAIGNASGLEVVVIRPPLVYGPGVKANFARLVQAVARGIPLPLGSVDNRRSLVGLDNLTDLITSCVQHPTAAHQTFLVVRWRGHLHTRADPGHRPGHGPTRPPVAGPCGLVATGGPFVGPGQHKSSA